MSDLWGNSQGIWETHDETQCAGRPCCLHAPSPHHMNKWDLTHAPTRYGWLSSRTCQHDMKHPDPDSAAYLLSRLGGSTRSIPPIRFGASAHDRDLILAHDCDGCCVVLGCVIV